MPSEDSLWEFTVEIIVLPLPSLKTVKSFFFCIFPRVAPDIRPAGYPAFFDIRYPAGYPVSLAGYPAGYPVGRIAGYPARKTLHGTFFLQNLGLH